MDSRKHYEHLKYLQQKEDQRQEDFDRHMREKQNELKVQMSEIMTTLNNKMMEIKEEKHRIDVTNLQDQLLRVKDEMRSIELYTQNKMLEQEIDHKTNLAEIEDANRALSMEMDQVRGKMEMIEIYNNNMRLEQDIDHKRQIVDMEDENRLLDMENKKYSSVLEIAEKQMQLLKEQSVIESKRGQLKDEMYSRLERLTDWRNEQFDRELNLREDRLELEQDKGELEMLDSRIQDQKWAIAKDEELLKEEERRINDVWKMKKLEQENRDLKKGYW